MILTMNEYGVLCDNSGNTVIVLEKNPLVAAGFIRYTDGNQHVDTQCRLLSDGTIKTVDGFALGRWEGEYSRLRTHPIS